MIFNSKVLIASITTFAATNIDDIFLLTLFVTRRVPTRRIVVGQLLGFAAVVALGCAGALAALSVPMKWISYLGVIPLALGIKGLIRLVRPKKTSEAPAQCRSTSSIAVFTFLTGTDNVGVYIPFFRINSHQLGWILIEFALLMAALCFVGIRLGHHPVVLRTATKIGKSLVPVVFIGLGIYMLAS